MAETKNMNCNKIRTMIDEADGQGNIPFEAARHIQTCEGCNKFADERAKLFKVLNSVGRITAPPDFQVSLRRRLRERSAVKSVPWYAQAFNMKLAGAFAAAVICAVVVVQFVGVRNSRQDQAKGLIAQDVSPLSTQDNPTVPKNPGPSASGKLTETEPSPTVNPVRVVLAKHRIIHERNEELASAITGRSEELATSIPGDMSRMPVNVMLLRGEGTEQQMLVPTVTVGSQPTYYLGRPSSDDGQDSGRARRF